MFDWSNNTDAIYVGMDGFVLGENGTLKLSLSLKLPLICSMNFLSPEVALCLYKSTIRSRMEYFCHICAGAPCCCLELSDKLQKRICRTVGPSLAFSLEHLAHRLNIASLRFFYR